MRTQECECKNNEDFCEFCRERIEAAEKAETLRRGETMQLEAIGRMLGEIK